MRFTLLSVLRISLQPGNHSVSIPNYLPWSVLILLYAYMHSFIFPSVKVYQTLTASVDSHLVNVTNLRDHIDRLVIHALKMSSIDLCDILFQKSNGPHYFRDER